MLSFETTCAFFVASLLMAMTPGPDVIIVLTQSSLYGMRAGVLTTLGLMTGLLGHTLAVALGVAVLFQTSEAAFTALKFLGAAYLVPRVAILPVRGVPGLPHTVFVPRIRHALSAGVPLQHHQPQGDAVLPCGAAAVRGAGTGPPDAPDPVARRPV